MQIKYLVANRLLSDYRGVKNDRDSRSRAIRAIRHIISGNDIWINCRNIFGRNTLLGQMNILLVVSEMFRRKCYENIWKTKGRKVVEADVKSV